MGHHPPAQPSRERCSLASTPRVALADLERVALRCVFRTCDWTSEEVTTAPQDIREALAIRHLLRAHRADLRTLAGLAADAGVL